MSLDVTASVAPIRHKLLRPARPAPAGPLVRLAAWLTVAGSLAYVGQKLYMASRGEVGMPGHPASAQVQAQFEHPGLAQAGNATLGLVAALVAWATIAAWGARVPRWALLCALFPAAVTESLGAALIVQRAALDLEHLDWYPCYETLSGSIAIASWLTVALSYTLRSRPWRVQLSAHG
ncbi:hypothetical protein ACQEU8_17900 [Streptomyces sp. CA-250714]|uniref:hypothetical protein n=1 Tax=Streptomyces sp. CA-250714 TaxID=3240060 RepID=UPI003D8D7AC5